MTQSMGPLAWPLVLAWGWAGLGSSGGWDTELFLGGVGMSSRLSQEHGLPLGILPEPPQPWGRALVQPPEGSGPSPPEQRSVKLHV